MKRAVTATAGTVAGLVLLLGYKSAFPNGSAKVAAAGTPPGASVTGPTTPTTSGPSPATSAPSAGSSPATSGSSPATTATTASPAHAYNGQLVSYFYGDIQVDVSVRGGRVVSVTVPRNDAADAQSQMINSEAVPILQQEALSAQSLNFNVVSGATYTSDAFAQSLQSALQQAGK